MNPSTLRTVLIVFGVSQLALGAMQVIAPGTFFDSIGGFGAENRHYIRDAATLPLAVGVAALLAAGRVGWRAPVLWVSALWYAFHAVNHLADISDSNRGWVGPVDFASLALGALVLGWLASRADRTAGIGL